LRRDRDAIRPENAIERRKTMDCHDEVATVLKISPDFRKLFMAEIDGEWTVPENGRIGGCRWYHASA
jgi:hypothetical protein